MPVSVLPDVLLEPWAGGAFVDEPDAWLCTAFETLVCAPAVSFDPVPVPALPDSEAGWARAKAQGGEAERCDECKSDHDAVVSC